MTRANDVAVGIVGLGGIGNHHATKLTERGANLVGGMDIDADVRRRFHEEFGVRAYEDETELYEECDAVLVTTPNRFHEEYAVSALEAGLGVLLEKPLAHTLGSAERIAAAARDAEGFCMVGFNNRFAEPVQVIKGYQEEGRFGETTHVEANYVRRRGVPGRGSWFTSGDVAGGGALIDIGVHAVDLALYFLDHPEVIEVSGETRSEFGGRDDYAYLHMWGDDDGPDGFDVEDSASAFIRDADGNTVSLEVAWATNRPTNDEFVIWGTEAGATFDRGSDELAIHEASALDGGRHHFSDAEVETREGDSHAAEQATFLDAVAAGEAPAINTIEEGLSVQRVIDAIYRSSERGEAVRLD
ncbi:Gfo/Idh/MocA family protein [Halorubrum yunnanense]|uniref:Gfo/Idh/MocA family protein n=1 Tax=Halorubrum yunnanense TaxID=1526162 RepID=A0ABD5YGU7_9EURY|nr:Gfo/Idh/MocA family oxidoreductase [Halorubrum yunnanense]